MPSLSVCIPTYNQGAFIEECLDSLLCQSRRADEIVVSNNHSSDETDQILANYGSRIKVVRPPIHLGMVQNYQFCASQASSDWVAFMTSDDVAEFCFVEVLIDGVLRYPSAAVVRAGHSLVDSNSRIIGKRSLLSVADYVSADDFFFENIGGPKTFFEAAAFRRDAWQAVQGFDGNIALLGDWALWVRLSQIGGAGLCKRLISRYRYWERADRGLARAPTEMKDELIIYRDHILPLAEQKGASFVDEARRCMAVRSLSMLAKLSNNLDSTQLADIQDLVLSYAAFMGHACLAKEILETGHRVSISTSWRSRARVAARTVFESLRGWRS